MKFEVLAFDSNAAVDLLRHDRASPPPFAQAASLVMPLFVLAELRFGFSTKNEDSGSLQRFTAMRPHTPLIRIGTMRRECLDWIIPLCEEQIRRFVREWATHYNRARPHMSLDYGVPEPNEHVPAPPLAHRHRLPDDAHVVTTPILGGLAHEYRLDRAA